MKSEFYHFGNERFNKTKLFVYLYKVDLYKVLFPSVY